MLLEILSILAYFFLGLALFFLGYKVFDWMTPFNLQEELDNHNLGAGFAVAGLFIGLAIIVAGAILPV